MIHNIYILRMRHENRRRSTVHVAEQTWNTQSDTIQCCQRRCRK